MPIVLNMPSYDLSISLCIVAMRHTVKEATCPTFVQLDSEQLTALRVSTCAEPVDAFPLHFHCLNTTMIICINRGKASSHVDECDVFAVSATFPVTSCEPTLRDPLDPILDSNNCCWFERVYPAA